MLEVTVGLECSRLPTRQPYVGEQVAPHQPVGRQPNGETRAAAKRSTNRATNARGDVDQLRQDGTLVKRGREDGREIVTHHAPSENHNMARHVC